MDTKQVTNVKLHFHLFTSLEIKSPINGYMISLYSERLKTGVYSKEIYLVFLRRVHLQSSLIHSSYFRSFKYLYNTTS